MDHLRFETIARGIEINDQRRVHDIDRLVPANRYYVILFTARSGSTWLTSVLSATNRLGFPEEFINPDFMQDVVRATNARTADDLFASLKRRRKTPNLVFGMEARHIDVELVGAEAFQRAFGPETLFFNLWRENLVAQGISLYRAVATERYHSTSATAASAKTLPPFDADAILEWVEHIARTENGNVGLLQQMKVPTRHLVYETIVGNRRRAVGSFAEAMAVPFEPGEFAGPTAGELVKLGDDWNLQTEARLRAERPEPLARIEADRLVKQNRSTMEHPSRPAAPEALDMWLRGHRCGAAGRSPRNNPFPPRTAEGEIWMRGWRRGWDGSELTAAELPRTDPPVDGAPRTAFEGKFAPALVR